MEKKVIFFTGAGISKESGVPTFQEMDGIRKKLRRKYAILHPRAFRKLILNFLYTKDDYEPNPAHIWIAKMGCPVITMNVDGLHQKAGSKDVLAIHGDIPTVKELSSFWYPFLPLGKPVLYGDMAPRYYKAFRSIRSLKKGDYFVIVGTSFYTNISRDIKRMAEKRGATVIEINENASVEVPKVCAKISKELFEEFDHKLDLSISEMLEKSEYIQSKCITTEWKKEGTDIWNFRYSLPLKNREEHCLDPENWDLPEAEVQKILQYRGDLANYGQMLFDFYKEKNIKWPIKMYLNAVTDFLPPWMVFPLYSSRNLGWRMGFGEDYKEMFFDFLFSLTEEEREIYEKAYPEPDYMEGWRTYE